MKKQKKGKSLKKKIQIKKVKKGNGNICDFGEIKLSIDDTFEMYTHIYGDEYHLINCNKYIVKIPSDRWVALSEEDKITVNEISLINWKDLKNIVPGFSVICSEMPDMGGL